MIYAYKITDSLIQYLGASDEQERLVKALEMAEIDTEGVQYTETEPVQAGGKYFLSENDPEYQRLKAQEEEAQRISSLMPTSEERLAALEDAILEMTEG